MGAKPKSEKDLLMSKLVPALNDNPFSSYYEGTDEELSVSIPSKNDDALSSLHNRLFARDEKATNHSFAPVNLMEALVLQHMDSVMKRFNVCRCDRCSCDVVAYTLNQLPTKYVVADAAHRKELEEAIATKLVLDALVNAVIKVRANPRH